MALSGPEGEMEDLVYKQMLILHTESDDRTKALAAGVLEIMEYRFPEAYKIAHDRLVAGVLQILAIA